jgi:hypothetical protein
MSQGARKVTFKTTIDRHSCLNTEAWCSALVDVEKKEVELLDLWTAAESGILEFVTDSTYQSLEIEAQIAAEENR